MNASASLAKLSVPLTAQEIELLRLDCEGAAMRQLRVRIRERSRFTTLDLDPLTAGRLGELLCRFAEAERPHVARMSEQGAAACPASEACDA